MTPEAATALRRPFPPESVGRLPKGGVMLDYVGHAAVTDRLLTVDPEWSWEPFALDDHGLPALDRAGNLWIRLTICGVTRIGVGDGKNAKEVIGDAIRNAAMRFGVALDLWAKENLVEFAQHATGTGPARPEPRLPDPSYDARPPVAPPVDPEADSSPLLHTKSGLAKRLFATMNAAGMPDDRDARLAEVSALLGRDVSSSSQLTEAEARTLIRIMTTGEQEAPS